MEKRGAIWMAYEGGNWKNGLGIGTRDAEALDHRGEHQHRHGERKLRADADTRPVTERKIGEALRLAHEETRGNEGIRVLPKLKMTVQNPGRDRDDRAAPGW